MSEKYDIAIIGGGPGGYVAAIRAAQLGRNVVVIEANHLGGICLNWGCIPTKALLRSAEIYHLMNHGSDYGIKAKDVSFDFKKIIQRSRDVSKQLADGVTHLLKKNKVNVVDGYGTLNGKNSIIVRQSSDKKSKIIAEIEADHIILATGARARSLPGLEPDGKLIWDYKTAMTPDSLPKSLLVVGSGAIGIEFANFYHALGVDVTVVEVVDRIMPVEDEEISAMAQKRFESAGIKIKTGTTVSAIKKGKNNITATLKKDEKSEEQKFDRAIMAVGIVPNSENIGLETVNVTLDRGHIVTDKWCMTSEEGIYALGDVAGAPWLAHKASHEGIVCVEKIAGKGDVHPMKKENIPGCTYSNPQVASVGLTEKQAQEQGHSIKVGRFPFIGNGKAIALGEPEGLVKTIFDKNTGELLGAHMIGAEVTELIQGFVIGKTMEATEEDFIHSIFPHPTLSEMMHESVLDAFGRAIHF